MHCPIFWNLVDGHFLKRLGETRLFCYFFFKFIGLLKVVAMKVNLNIRQRILLYVLGPVVLLCSFAFLYVSVSARRNANNLTVQITDSYSKQYAQNIEKWLNEDFAVTRTLASAFLEYRNLPQEQWLVLFRNMYNHVISTTLNIDAYWDSWEIKSLDPAWGKDYGRYFYIVYHENGQIMTKSEIRSLNGNSEAYQKMIENTNETIEEPYVSALQGGVMMSTLCSPIRYNNVHIGLVAADIKLTRFQNLVNEIKPFPNSEAFLITYEGNFVAHHDTSIFGRNVVQRLPELDKEFSFLKNIQKGQAFSFTTKNAKGEKYYYSVAPIIIGNTSTPWALGILVPYTDMMAEANHSYNVGIIIALISILILIIVIVAVAYGITLPIKKITDNLKDLALGKVNKSMDFSVNTHDEIGQMSLALSASIKGIFEKTEFAKKIGEGNLDAEVTLLSEYDVLGKSLIEMRNNLRKADSDDEMRKREEQKTRWINEGLAKFGEILRHNNDNLELLCDDVIKNLVWYLNASLGGLFMETDKDGQKTYDLVSAFAYDRKRYLQKSYQEAEGLIGACAAERDVIMLNEIPQDYIEITSGLGDTNPNFLFLVPLINEEEVLGVIELASLHGLEEHEVRFVKELARSIASTLQTVRVNSLTNDLFNKSKQQAEIMSAQEEEMRQNLEELQATQEEATRKSYELEGLVNALNASLYVVEYDTKGFVTSINDSYLEAIAAKRDDIIGSHLTEDMVLSEFDKQNYDHFWDDLLHGQIKKRTSQVAINGKQCKLLETYTSIKNENGDVYKILKIATDITNL